ncbi:MAG: hypothetical protein LBE36_13430 [Flavobacteriaceae bacterium]|jgi:hypothetical protein|nr:hypothetical protein [Flavobacteriaceae bacterium]
MERKLELQEISGYLPYGLKLTMPIVNGVYNICQYNFKSQKVNVYSDEHSAFSLSGYLAILRPLSDLYKPIQHNGKEEIPIVECGKICGFYGDGNELFNLEELLIKYATRIETIIETFDYLHSRFIDYRGLIEVGLAIDLNTLEINPYL